ncbi:MAG: diaminopimelate decarboxylase [Oscillospiraceae bacterium]|nr:diaminopimelate decarboxylase [Oscillospiraceae bacterium]
MVQDFLCSNLSAGADGRLLFAGQDTAELARQYGTPLYLMDEQRIRERCRTYVQAVKTAFGGRGRVLFASKAAAFKRMFAIMAEEGMCADVVSPGEIWTAARAGFPMERAWFHSSNKSDEDLAFAMEQGVGAIVVDSTEELFAVDRIAAEKGVQQAILLRLTPGIDPHTFEAVATGKVDSKFGFGIETGLAETVTQTALSLSHVSLVGFHSHVGSEVFDSDVFIRSAEIMLQYIALVKERYGYEAGLLDLGGGYGVRYLHSQPDIDLAANIAEVGAYIARRCRELGIEQPEIAFEPGRSIVADAGLTLYTVGMVKRIPGIVNYVSVDGGMTDNIRYALYQAPYTVLAAGKLNEEQDMRCTVVGRCCESGDIIQPDVELPASIRRGDLLAVCTTGAYNYSMASNYNRVPRPPVVMLNEGESYVAVRRESLDDLLALDE